MVNICFLLLILIILTLVGQSVADQPTWPTSCSMSLYTRKWSRLHPPYSLSYPGSESLCREKCEGDSSCGMYIWEIRNDLCQLYHTSLELVAQVMGVKGRVLFNRRPRRPAFNMGSKKCEGVIYDHTHCPDYPKHYEGKYIDDKHRIIRVYLTTSLTPSQCQHLCSTYPQCRSVRREVWSSSLTGCYLYSTTITELVESGKEDEVLTDRYHNSITYERYCGDVPYDPPTTETTTSLETTTFLETTIPSETTTPPLDCSNLSTLDGATLCLPIGHGDEATCQAIPGCCFVEVGGLVPFTMCIKQNYC